VLGLNRILNPVGTRCLHSGCDRRSLFVLPLICRQHWVGHLRRQIDQCPACFKAKYRNYDICPRCNDGELDLPAKLWKTMITSSGDYDGWHVYVLKFREGDRYVGVTQNLPNRLNAHEAGEVRASSGRQWRLEYFDQIPRWQKWSWLRFRHRDITSRQDAARYEAILKAIFKQHPEAADQHMERFERLVHYTKRPSERGIIETSN